MAKKPKRKPDDPAQSKRFVETAKDLGADESGKSFEKVAKKVLHKSMTQPKKK